MVLRVILRYLSNNEHLIHKLSESKPVRRAAQLFVSFYYRGQSVAQESGLKNNLSPQRFQQFVRRLSNNFKLELENAKRQLEEKNKK